MINLDVLHNVPRILEERGSFPRQIGKTTYSLYNVLGFLQVLRNETIIILVDNESCVRYYHQQLQKLFEENGLEAEFNYDYRRIRFTNNSNQIKILSLKTIQEMFPPDLVHPRSWDVYLITDLNNMPPDFYHEDITIKEMHKLEKYKNYF